MGFWNSLFNSGKQIEYSAMPEESLLIIHGLTKGIRKFLIGIFHKCTK